MTHTILFLCLTIGQPDAAGLSTFAGTGARGHTGDGGPAIKATLSEPFHCDLDGRGHLYIAESMNHCIRKVDLRTGIITTVAGNGKKGYTGDGAPAMQATFNEPYAVTVAKNDDLYVVDRNNAVVRKVDGKTGIVTTVAGNGRRTTPATAVLESRHRCANPTIAASTATAAS